MIVFDFEINISVLGLCNIALEAPTQIEALEAVRSTYVVKYYEVPMND